MRNNDFPERAESCVKISELLNGKFLNGRGLQHDGGYTIGLDAEWPNGRAGFWGGFCIETAGLYGDDGDEMQVPRIYLKSCDK